MAAPRSVKKFKAWAHQEIRARARALGLQYEPEDVIDDQWMGYYITYLKYVSVVYEDEDGVQQVGRTPIAWVGTRSLTPSAEGSGEDTTLVVEATEPFISSVFPDLVFVLTPEGERVYRKVVEREEEENGDIDNAGPGVHGAPPADDPGLPGDGS